MITSKKNPTKQGNTVSSYEAIYANVRYKIIHKDENISHLHKKNDGSELLLSLSHGKRIIELFIITNYKAEPTKGKLYFQKP